ncbi:hypothetical protein BGW38_001664, partial [Lunasporangiospora selenospora]
MGDYVLKKRQLSRSRDDESYSESDLTSEFESDRDSQTDYSDSDSFSDRSSAHSRARKRTKYSKRTLLSDSDDSVIEVRGKEDSHYTLNGSLKDMVIEMNKLNARLAVQMAKADKTAKMVKTVWGRISERLTDGAELEASNLLNGSEALSGVGPATKGAGRYGQGHGGAPPMRPPPSVIPVTSGPGLSDAALEYVHALKTTTLSNPSQTRQAAGYMRVFEKTSYNLPIASQKSMEVMAIGHRRQTFEKVMSSKRQYILELNPFSHRTKFEGIVVSSGLDGCIHFWNFDTQQHLLSLTAKSSRIIPYADAISWVSEDTIVAVSHLKRGIIWPPARTNPDDVGVDPTLSSLPETQANLITIYFNQNGLLNFKLVTITSMPHSRAIDTVASIIREDRSVSFVTGGKDKQLYHWKFQPPSGHGETVYEPQGLEELHHEHTATITSTLYNHQSKLLYSGGIDGRYVCYDLVKDTVLWQLRVGSVVRIIQNPVDPRINGIARLTKKAQYALVDERTPGRAVLEFGYDIPKRVSKLSIPSWHPEGGILCSGTHAEGIVMLWDVRWSSIAMEHTRRPGQGVVTRGMTVDVNSLDNDDKVLASKRSNIKRKVLTRSKNELGGPSQVLYIGGKQVLETCFHPTKDVLVTFNADFSAQFMNYRLLNGLNYL